MLAVLAGPAVAQPVPPVTAPPPVPVPVPAPTAPAATSWGSPLPPAVPPAPLPAVSAPLPGTGTGLRPQLVPAADPRPTGTSRVLTYQKPSGADAPPKPGGAAGEATQPPAVPGLSGGVLRDQSLRLDVTQPFEADGDLLRRLARELEREAQDRPLAGGTAATADFYRAPPLPPLVPPGTEYRPKTLDYPPAQRLLEPGYVTHRRLYFEELNSERYGWDLGFAQPVISTLHFWKDSLLYPARAASNLFERYDVSAGKCVPGSPVPYYLYPPEVDLFGATVGAGAIIGVAAILP